MNLVIIMDNISIKVNIYDKICLINYYIDIYNIYRYSVYDFVNIMYLQDINSNFSMKLLTQQYPDYFDWVMNDNVKTYTFSKNKQNIPVMHITQLQQLYFKLSLLSANSEIYIPHGYSSIIFNVLAGNYQLDNFNLKIDKLNDKINMLKSLLIDKDKTINEYRTDGRNKDKIIGILIDYMNI